MKQSRMLPVILSTALILSLSAPALAAPEPGISVQLDGENLTFTDAAPQARDGRTFLPFRTVFEAMGAQVSNEGSVITAVRDGKTLHMTLGSTEATLIQGETVTPIAMDVAPYVDETTWRTYVPVRFAAQAFGCAVGWDQDDQTAILVDTEKLLTAAQADKKYTILEQYVDYTRQFMEGAWAFNADFDADMSVMGMGPATMSGTLEGAVANSLQTQMSMKLKLDLKQLLEDRAALTAAITGIAPEAMTAEELAMLEALKTDGLGMEMRMDLGKGTTHLTFAGKTAGMLELPAGTWYSMDMDAALDQTGMNVQALTDPTASMDPSTALSALLQGAQLTDRATAYATVSTLVESAASLFSDEGFRKEGSDYITSYTYTQDNTAVTMTFTLNTEHDKVAGYALDMQVAMTDPATGGSNGTMHMAAGVDAKNHMTAEIKMDMLGLTTVNMTLSGDCQRTDKTPESLPPADATVVPFQDLAGAGA